MKETVSFASLGLCEPLQRALAARDYQTPTPIQAQAIPHLLDGRDLLGIAQTGTGKTAAFALPMLQRLVGTNYRPAPGRPRALVLAPTRELATQIADSCIAYGKHMRLQVAIAFGGVGQTPQVQALRRGVDILVATPGRLLDLIKQRHCDLGDTEILVLDEADRMLDMGFLPDVKRILATLPKDRQSLLFSATMPPDITTLANRFLVNPLRIEVTPPAATADRIEQSVHFVTKDGKRDLLAKLLAEPAFARTLVFTRTKHGADRVVKHLIKEGIQAHAIHGNKSQGARERALDAFRNGKTCVLVATDIAARGIDVQEISHVVNFDLPNIPESYVHRIGRTARAGRDGIAISFCDEGEREFLRDIEKLIKQRIPVAGKHHKSESTEPKRAAAPQPKPAPVQRDDAWSEAAAGQNPSDRPRERQRPAQRPTPGPYLPAPPKPDAPRRDPNAQNGQHRGDPRKGGQRRGPHKHRPATPHYIDPEQRRHVPKQTPATEGERSGPPRRRSGRGRRRSGPRD